MVHWAGCCQSTMRLWWCTWARCQALWGIRASTQVSRYVYVYGAVDACGVCVCVEDAAGGGWSSVCHAKSLAHVCWEVGLMHYNTRVCGIECCGAAAAAADSSCCVPSSAAAASYDPCACVSVALHASLFVHHSPKVSCLLGAAALRLQLHLPACVPVGLPEKLQLLLSVVSCFFDPRRHAVFFTTSLYNHSCDTTYPMPSTPTKQPPCPAGT